MQLQIHCTLKEYEGNLCLYMLIHSYNYPSSLCKCTQPNIHSEIVSGQLPPNTCNTKGSVYPHKSSPTHHIFTKFSLKIHYHQINPFHAQFRPTFHSH